MGIPQQHPLTPDQLRNHKALIARCRGATCLSELGLVFGTVESNALERIIDGKTARRNADGEASWSRKYARYLKGTVPDPSTVLLAEQAAAVIGRTTRLRYWRDNPLWALLAEPAIPLEAVRLVMAGLPRIVREQLYHLGALDPYGRQMRQDFTRNSAIQMRDTGSMDAFIGLLALAREGEILDENPKHGLAARCAFEMLPKVLRDNPPLQCTWPGIFEVLKLAFWSRVYHSGIVFPEYTLANAERGLEALVSDKSTALPWSAGRLAAMEDS